MADDDQTLLGQSGGEEGGEPETDGEDGAPTQEAHPSGLSNDLVQDPTIQKFMDEQGQLNTENLAKSYVNAQSMIGRDKIPLPKDDAPEEEWQQVFNRLGRPEDPKEYQLEDPDDLPDELHLPDSTKEGIKAKAHELGLLPKQVQGVYEFFMSQNAEMVQEHYQQVEQQIKDGEQALRKEWGNAYEAEVNKAKKAMQSFVPEESQEDFITKYGNDPTVIKLLNNVGNQITEGSLKGKSSAANFTMTPDEAQRRIDSINKDPKHPYWKGDKQAVKEVNDLFAAASGTSA